jgi:uncharacterized membrane protein
LIAKYSRLAAADDACLLVLYVESYLAAHLLCCMSSSFLSGFECLDAAGGATCSWLLVLQLGVSVHYCSDG